MPVQQHVLNWLYSVLTSEYHDVNRTYSDVAQALSHYPTLSPKTDVYTFTNGQSSLLLHLSGTLPVVFRGATYRFPISLWVPHAYPREAPLVYVTPTESMVVRPGQHVDPQGQVYHPYLVGWSEFWDKSSIVDFLAILRDVFAKEPPVVSRQQQQQRPPPGPQQAATPPPVPPLPPDLARRAAPPAPQPPQQATAEQKPPMLPPKRPDEGQSQHVQHAHTPGQVHGAQSAQHTAPPPAPPYHPIQQGAPPPGQSAAYQRPAPSRYESAPPLSVPGQPAGHQPPPPSQQPPYRPGQTGAPPSVYASTPSPVNTQLRPQPPPPQYVQQHPPQHDAQRLSAVPPPIQAQQPLSSWAQGGPVPPPGHQYAPLPPQVQPQPQQQQPPAPKPPRPNLLDDDLEDKSATPPTATGQPPPIPPNPEKDMALRRLATTLHGLRMSTAQQHSTSLLGLAAQRNAMLAALDRINADTAALANLSALLASNANILRDAIRRAEAAIESVRAPAGAGPASSQPQQAVVRGGTPAASKAQVAPAARGAIRPPHVDELLVAPTVVANQLYDLVAEERALGDAIFMLGRAVERGRISPHVFAKMTRSLGREWYLKKALVRKIAHGMGLLVD